MFAKRPNLKEGDQELLLAQECMIEEGKLKVDNSTFNKINSEIQSGNEKINEYKEFGTISSPQINTNAKKTRKISLYAMQKMKVMSTNIENSKNQTNEALKSNHTLNPNQYKPPQNSTITPSIPGLITGEGLMVGNSEEEKRKVEKEVKKINETNMAEMNKMSEEEIMNMKLQLMSNPGWCLLFYYTNLIFVKNKS